MKFNSSRIWVMLTTSVLVMFAIFSLSGCGSGDSAGIYTGKISYIGVSKGTLADKIEATFVNSVAYDGESTDAPIFIAESCIQSLKSTEQEGIRRTYANLKPIVLIHGNADQINTLLDILGLEQNYTLPEGLPENKDYAELFAIDREADGSVFIWSMYPPGDGVMQPRATTPPTEAPTEPLPDPVTDSDSEQFRRTEMLRNWIDNNGNRLTSKLEGYRQDAIQALVVATDTTAELTQIVPAFVYEKNFSNGGNHYTLYYYIYSCHSFNEADARDYDWFYVRQEGMFNASGGYNGPQKNTKTIWNDQEVHYYVGKYSMNNWMEGLDFPGSGVSLMTAQPENANNKETVTSGVNWNIGGSVGFFGTSATGTMDAGVSITNSSTFTVTDCTLTNRSAEKTNNARWSYEFNKTTHTVSVGKTEINTPTLLSRSNFQPVNQWIWKFSPDIREEKVNSFVSEFDVDLIQSVSGHLILPWVALDAQHNVFDGGLWTINVPLPFPPLLVAPHNLDFSAEGQYKTLNLAVARSWTASSDQDWCSVKPGADSLVYITVDSNTTGEDREAEITYTTDDGNASDKTKVIQSRF
ncbi:MAG: BACON domain-containing carbohydrate-binding protein [Desulforegulaceae bacterium]|nr:BACON domain-containing carbohydrate-binding protein [Desulforegulaceae bacterium]